MNSRPQPSPLCAAFWATLLLAVGEAPAAPGDLDTTFGTGGKVITDFPAHGHDDPIAVAVQPDGKILVGGIVGVPTTGDDPGDFGLARYNSDGSLDQSYGTGGWAATNLDGQPSNMVLQPDGKVILIGYHDIPGVSTDFALARFLPNGQLDPAFGAGGKVITDLGGKGETEFANGAALQPDGAILVAGTTNPPGVNAKSAVVRYTTGGIPDTTFGNGGKLITDVGESYAAVKVAVQGSGKFIVAALSSAAPDGEAIALSRFDAAGHLDTTFGTGGAVVESFGESESLAGMIVLSDGKILLAGSIFGPSGHQIFLARYQPDGAPDNAFGTAGKAFIPPPVGEHEQCNGIVLQPGGEILIAAGTDRASGFLLLRCHADGSLDPGFGIGGRVFTPGNHYSQAVCLALQGDGKIVVAGSVSFNPQDDFLVIRYEGSPVLTPLETWRQKWFGISTNTENAADDFDYDGDGLANLIEWATGQDPTSREMSPVAAVLNGTNLSLTYPLSDAALSAGTTLTVEWTDDLSGPWHSDGVVTSILSDDGNLREMQAVLPAGTSGRRFVRLKATRP